MGVGSSLGLETKVVGAVGEGMEFARTMDRSKKGERGRKSRGKTIQSWASPKLNGAVESVVEIAAILDRSERDEGGSPL